ncbi:NAD-binding protein of Kef-type K+ transporter [Acrocarpospora phusangensis]|uniref:NAD-binding protein of Kef-type K+ transporter n=1 Tax=Acrocarpospora phusangensis TaxID=1070424 RepID=A0A919UKV4_9ACTN|nr:potassium channel family protein [Acrocarpospora phusangensis]GIH25456.1 NAD-binding protein of Kef-type K+ transporter [Acrocarpospora phusangensis]
MTDEGIRLPRISVSPLRAVLRRIWYAFAALGLVFLLVAVDRDGYRDTYDGEVSVLDALYYATVTVSTTGYGDITPVSDTARLINILAVTPLRIVFLVVLVGTTLEVLTQRTREEFLANRWRSRLSGHTVVVGYGTKGRAAIRTLLDNERAKESIVVVDPNPAAIAEANEDGFVGVIGDGTRGEILRRARIAQAAEVIIATQRDDTTALVTLTARNLNPGATVVAAVRESENDPLVRRSGADVVITSSEATGRMLGVATQSPAVSTLIEDFLVYGHGLDLYERPVSAAEVGQPPSRAEGMVIAVVRDGQVVPYARVDTLAAGDQVVVIHVPEEEPGEPGEPDQVPGEGTANP